MQAMVTMVRVHMRRRRRRLSAVGAAVLVVALAAACTATPAAPDDDVDVPPDTTRSATDPVSGGPGLLPPDADGGAAVATDPGPSVPRTTAGPPEAPTLAWLDGALTETGIAAPADGVTYWHGRHGAEHAQIGDGWYRYFGADGALVGCAATGSCVGIGADGTVAILAAPGEPRAVYNAQGDYIGRYDADGAALTEGAAVAPDLTAALSTSGVNLADLVDAATLSAPFAGGVTGDPHITTGGGIRVTTQIAGEFVARGGDPTHRIQLRFSPMNYREDVSVVTAAAIGTGDNVVVIDAAGSVTVDGLKLPKVEQFQQRALKSGVLLGRWPADASGAVTTTVRWPDGGTVMVAARAALGLTVIAHLRPVAGAGGLFGSAPAASGSDMLSRNGGSGDASRAVTSWQVRTTERMLEGDGVLPLSFPPYRADPGVEATETGQRVCRGHGMTRVADIAACAFDIAVTGDTGFVPGHVALATAVESPLVPAPFARYWPALESASVLSASKLPPGGRIEVMLPEKSTRTYSFELGEQASVSVVNHDGCAEGEAVPTMQQPAMRLFNAAGDAVSSRWPLCGQHETPPLGPGAYSVLIANGDSGGTVRARLDLVAGG